MRDSYNAMQGWLRGRLLLDKKGVEVQLKLML